MKLFSTSKPQVQSGFNIYILEVIFKLMIMKMISASRHIIIYLIPFRLWQLKMFALGLINVKVGLSLSKKMLFYFIQ